MPNSKITEIIPIAYIKTDFPTKFGIPRQGAGISCIKGRIVFEKEYRDRNALRGLESFSHLWLIWHFSESPCGKWSATVRPPRLGGNKRVGVFATRSPFRPNPIGLTCVKIEEIEYDSADAPTILVSGADLMDGTPIFDIKPYLPYVDSIPDARGGFGEEVLQNKLSVNIPEELTSEMDADFIEKLSDILAQDPRPHYIDDPQRIFGFQYAGYDIQFRVCDDLLTVVGIIPYSS